MPGLARSAPPVCDGDGEGVPVPVELPVVVAEVEKLLLFDTVLDAEVVEFLGSSVTLNVGTGVGVTTTFFWLVLVVVAVLPLDVEEVDTLGGSGSTGPAPRAERAAPVFGSRYQLVSGSPRHSPAGTISKPRARALSIMNWAKPLTVLGCTS